MDRKEKVLAYMKSEYYVPMKLSEIATMLDVPKDSIDELLKILDELCVMGEIFITKKGRYAVCDASTKRFVGTLKCFARGKFAFLIPESGDDLYIPGDKLKSAINGDKVLAKITGEKNGKTEGAVIKVLERGNKTIVGVCTKKFKGIMTVFADDDRISDPIYVKPNNQHDAKIGERVLLSDFDYRPDNKIFGSIIKILGDKYSLKSCIESIIIQNKIKTEFEKSTINQVSKIDDEVTNWGSDRLDLRDATLFTIDGELARDFDDAVSINKEKDGLYKLGVHIADVSEYVTEGSPLDIESGERGTSVYLPDRVIPMLPEKLSNGVCSLNPNVDRLALSLIMGIDVNGAVISHELNKSVIRSKARLTYTEVNKILEEDDAELKQKYSNLLDTFYDMQKLSQILYNKRIKRGAIEFDFPEPKIFTDEDGFPTKIEREERGVSNKIIEEFMLIANETIAEYAFWAELPFVYRVHEAPSDEKLSAFQLFLKPLGLSIKGKIDDHNPVKPKAFEGIIKSVAGTPAEKIVSKRMLRSLMKAEYRSENLGHFGLAAKYYCHFTSPIRRYPDLIVHRVLKQFLDGKVSVSEKSTAIAAKTSSEREIAAELCERDGDDLMKAAYMTRFVGENFMGVVSGMTNFGMFVELDNSVEGMIRLENMTDDYYIYDEESFSLRGERTGKLYTVGDTVEVTLVRSDILAREIDFILAK